MVAYGYIRCSTGQQAESGLGLEAQAKSIEEAANRLGMNLAGVFSDEGLSGGLPLGERPGLLDAVSSLTKGDILIVANRSRLGRDVVNVALVEREITKRGAKVVSAAGEGSDLEAGPTADLVKTILDAVNAFEKAQIALRTRLALRAKRSRGERAGNVPYGFTSTPEGKLVPNPVEQTTIRLVQELRTRGVSVRGIVARLRARGVLSRKGKPLGIKQVFLILRAVA